MMDCDTTGVEPDIALIKYKKLVGEGFLKIVNQTVPAALRSSATTPTQVEEILDYINERETIEGAPHLKPEHLSVFDCAFKPANGERSIHYMGHVRMMGAIQPFISRRDQQDREHARGRDGRGDRAGLPRGLEARPQGDRDLPRQLQAHPAAVDRQEEGRRASIDTEVVAKLKKELAKAQAEAAMPHRRRLPAERTAVTHKFDIAGHEGYITVGLYPDGQPGEIFLKMAKEGSTVSGSDGLLRDDRLRGAPVRRAAARPGQQVRPRPVRAERASPATRRSRSPSRSSTTSSGGWARGSCPTTTRRALGPDRSSRRSVDAVSDTPAPSLSASGASVASQADPTPPADLHHHQARPGRLIGQQEQGEISGTSEAVTPPPASEVPPTAVDASPKEELGGHRDQRSRQRARGQRQRQDRRTATVAGAVRSR